MVSDARHGHNILELVSRFPRIIEVVNVLNTHNIRYGMFCSGTVETVTGYRQASDIDLLIDSRDVKRVENIVDDASTDYLADRIQISLINTDYIDFFGRSTYYNKYPFFFTDLVWENSYLIPVKHTEVRMLHPLETILVKAIQQRGEEVGKHDWEDARQLSNANINFDLTYAVKRLKEINADKRIFTFLSTIGFKVANTREYVNVPHSMSLETPLAYAHA